MTATSELRNLLQSDVDEILARSQTYNARERIRLLREAAERFDDAQQTLERAKIAWVIQALLSTLFDRTLPQSTSSQLASRLAMIIERDSEDLYTRRRALDSLGLIFLKAKEITDVLDKTIRSSFVMALSARDEELRDFAAEALSGEGILARRSPGGVGLFLSVPLTTATREALNKSPTAMLWKTRFSSILDQR
jgi:hypothetical protein